MSDLMAVKFVDGSTDTIEGLGLPYGGPANGKDLTGTYFTKDTDFALKWFPDNVRPLLFEHGLDGTVRLDPVGTFSVKSWDDRGGWVQAKLDEASEYTEAVKELVQKGALMFSSGSVDHLYTTTKAGAIRTWPLVEMSLTTRPANPDQPLPAFRSLPKLPAGHYAIKSADAAAHLAGLGIEAPKAMKAEMATADINDLPDSAFAYIEPGGKKDDQGKTTPRSKRHFPIHDAAHVRNALARAPQSPFGPKAMPKIQAAAEKLGVKVGGKSLALKGAADDCATGYSILQQLSYLMGCEAGEDDQLALLNRAADAITEWITSERAEIGTDDDMPRQMPMMGAYLSSKRAVKAGKRNSTADQAHIDAMHDHAVAMHAHATALGAATHSEGEADQPEEQTAALQQLYGESEGEDEDTGKSAKSLPVTGLAIRAGTDTETGMAPDDLAAFKADLSRFAVERAKEILGR